MKTVTSGDGAIVLDGRLDGIYVVTWFGHANPEIVDNYFDWFGAIAEQRLRARAPFVLISDALDAARPSPKVRAQVAARSDALPDFKALNVGNYLVVGSTLIRGAITAMQWLSRKAWISVVVASTQDALRRGLADLERAGVAPPRLDPACYERPKLP